MNLTLADYLLTLHLGIETTTIAGVCLWSLALYLSLASTREKVTARLEQGLLQVSQGRSRQKKSESQDFISLSASLLGVLPFFAIGFFCNYGVEISLGRSWAVSMGILACMGCGVYELGRRSQ